MKKTLVPVIAIIISVGLMGCKREGTAANPSEKVNDVAVKGTAAAPAAPEMPANIEKILGSYVGEFGDNKITMLITKAGSGVVSGRTIVGGNDRPFDGTLAIAEGGYVIEAREPGDHKDDGVFKFQIADADTTQLKGSWKANDTKRPEKTYTLARRKFEYKTNVGNYPEASQRLLKTADVENLMADELSMMRNEIFARHGYCFSRKEMRQQFENADWYIPNTVDIKGYLTDIEKKNIALIKRYEKYAEEYGDEYGR